MKTKQAILNHFLDEIFVYDVVELVYLQLRCEFVYLQNIKILALKYLGW